MNEFTATAVLGTYLTQVRCPHCGSESDGKEGCVYLTHPLAPEEEFGARFSG